MSSVMSSYRRSASDHFEPQDHTEPAAQRRLRGQLEQIDYTAFISNREVLSHRVGPLDAARFQRLAVATAHARAVWVAEALALGEAGQPPSAQQVSRLGELRAAFDELSAAYEALRRMVERGYLVYSSPPDR